jgi:PKD repeat protein
VATATGCKDSISKTAVIYAKPTVNFSYTPLYGDAPLNVTFTNQSSNDSTYFWQFGDGGTSAQENPVYTYTQNGEYNVTLVATSPYGCTASRTKPYSVIKTDLDYAVNEAAVQITPLPNGSSLAKVSVIGSNIGTRIIDHISYYVTLGGVGVIAEDWQGTLLSGQGLLDTFSAQFVVPEGKGDSYICVTAVNVNNGQQELRTDNNSQCLGISEGIKVMGPLPNPALNEAKLGLILPKHGKVTLDIANMLGQYIVQGLDLELPEGRSDYDLPVGQMTAGEYFIRILYNDEKIVRKFIISR